MKKTQKLLILISLFFTSISWAWNSTGHRLIAVIAYQHLNPNVREKVDILTQSLFPASPNPEYRFLRASIWPDQLRSRGVTAYNHWHFINLPWSPDHTAVPPSYFSDNSVWAIHHNEQILLNPQANQYQQAIALAFLIHLAGDAHQPLHCITQYSRQHPHGDAGGNFVTINLPFATNLHSYWDQGLGLFHSPGQFYGLSNKKVQILADTIMEEYPEKYFGNKPTAMNPQLWTEESFAIATKFSYSLPENSRSLDRYVKLGQDQVMQQVALAGYRLANLLNQVENIHGTTTNRKWS